MEVRGRGVGAVKGERSGRKSRKRRVMKPEWRS